MSLNKELSFKILIIFFNLVYHKSDNIYLSAKSILFIASDLRLAFVNYSL